MAERGTFDKVLAEIGMALLPLREALSSPSAFLGFMIKLGWDPDDIPQPLKDLGGGVETLYDELTRLLGPGGVSVGGSISLDAAQGSAGIGGTVNADSIGRTLHAVQQIIDGVRAIAGAPAAAIPAKLRDDGFAAKFPRQLVDFLIISYLRRYHPKVAFALRTLGVIRFEYAAPVGARPAYMHATLDLAALPQTIREPGLLLQNAFGWGTADLDFGELAKQVEGLLAAFGVDVRIQSMPMTPALAITQAPALDKTPSVVRASIFERTHPTGDFAAVISLMELPAVGAAKPGLALLPSFNGRTDLRMQLDSQVAVTFRSDLRLDGGIGLKVRPGEGITIVVGFADTDTASQATGSIDVKVERATEGQPAIVVIGSKDSTRLQLKGFGGTGGVRLSAHGNAMEADVFAEFELKGLEFVLQSGDADGFIAKILPSGGIGFGADLAVGFSHAHGIYFRGTSHLEIAIPAHVQLGPVEIQGLTISATPSGSGVPIGLGATFKAELGPLRAVVEQIGITADLMFNSDHDGNLGPLDLALKFKPPKGVGLSVDAGIVKGGGYLYIDADRGEYAGALELAFGDIVTIKAIGIITTKMPDGSQGFSLLIIMSAEFGTGIQLGFGFTLLAVGGLLGLNRTMNLQALMDGVRSGSITSVMFPKDIVANAPKIISDLRAFFPAKEGTFLIGPMAKLGWGTPTLVSLSVGLIIEIPGNIAILGVLQVILPAEQAAIIKLQVQFVGAIEFDKKRLFFFASLFDSRVVFLTIDGEMGLLVAWGDDANFVVSVGGFHPRFNPPPLPFPSPRRIHVSVLSTAVARVTCEGYFAVTSNTVQFGARVEVFFGLSALNVNGHLAFDALFQFSPFMFIIEVSASFGVSVLGVGLFSVGISGSLSGPTPWHIKGHGSISLLFWDIDVEFEKTWGDSRDTALPPIDVLPMLTDELGKKESWRAILPDTSRLLVTLRELPAEEADQVLHPAGILRMTQRALPLDLHLDKVGNRKPRDVDRLTVTATGLSRKDDAYELFAPAQFRDLSDSAKLSRPAYAREKSGLDLAATGADTRTSALAKRLVRYEEIIIDNNFKRYATRYSPFIKGLFDHFLAGSAIKRMDISQHHRDRMQPFKEKVTVSDETFTVAFQATNTAAAAQAFTSAEQAHDFLAQQHNAADLHVLPTYEVAAP